METVKAGPSEGFTKVPHALLRGECRFGEPLDFMVYLHLYTYSYGFGRREADMSQAQLERFTGAAKNTIKRSLDRLAAQGWIKCVQEFECARMSRRWLVTAPEDRSGKPSPKSKRTVVKTDPVRTEQSPPVTGSLSTADPLTLSKIDTYLERDPKEKSKNSLSPAAPALCEYFANVKPFGKRESELRAYRGLRQDFSEEQIAAGLVHLRAKGVPVTGAPCHSPMGFLAKAMGQIWGEVQIEQAKHARLASVVGSRQELLSRREAEDADAERDECLREMAFAATYSDSRAQNEVVTRHARRFPMLNPDGPVLRGLAIAAWWAEQNEPERTA